MTEPDPRYVVYPTCTVSKAGDHDGPSPSLLRRRHRLLADPSNAAVCRDAEADRQDSEGAIPAPARVAAPTPRTAAQSGPTRQQAENPTRDPAEKAVDAVFWSRAIAATRRYGKAEVTERGRTVSDVGE